MMISSLVSNNVQIQKCSKPASVFAIAILVVIAPIKADASPMDDSKEVAALDTQYQAAVKANDAIVMGRILADDFVLVTGRGVVATKADLLKEAREKQTIYEHQEEEKGSQKVRIWGDTAVVTALLWIKGVREGKPIDYKLWFSDTYARTPVGWWYVFGQASLPLPERTGAK
jgi:ketosteroid isomerase-like protein